MPRDSTQVGEGRIQANLHAHAQTPPLPPDSIAQIAYHTPGYIQIIKVLNYYMASPHFFRNAPNGK